MVWDDDDLAVELAMLLSAFPIPKSKACILLVLSG